MPRITLSKSNFFSNLDTIAQKTGGREKIALVLKDNAYGHGLHKIAQLACEYGIKKAVVRLESEAKEIESYFEYILVLGEMPTLKSSKIFYTVNDINAIKNFAQSTKVELKVDTGMGRNGVALDEVDVAIALIEQQGLHLEAVFTHHSSADVVNGSYEIQKERFALLKKRLPSTLRFHSANSATLFREEEFSEDMARVGIAAYGCLEMPKELATLSLKPILSLYATKNSTRRLRKNESVGYGATFCSEVECYVSNYDVGYGDGFSRLCSNHYVTPEGVEIAGRISMDNSSFLCEEEELLIFNDANYVAPFAQTISYEVLTSLKPHIKREIVEL